MSETNSVYDLTDEEFLKLNLDSFDEVPEEEEAELETEDETDQETPDDSEEDESSETDNDESENEDDETDTDDEQETEGQAKDSGYDKSDDELLNDNDTEDTDVTQEETDTEETADADVDTEESKTTNDTEEKEVNNASDIEAFYAKITAPFKANGKEITITNADDAIALMQQGVNYSKNMADIKPSKAILKTLKEHNLTKPEDISYLIDLHNKDPKAIAKLIKDSDINLYEFDTEIADGYAPSQKVVEPTKLDDVVESLGDNPMFTAILDDIVDGWDTHSKRFITSNPEVLRLMTSQKQSGIYDKIVEAVEYDRLLGKLEGVSDIEAYTIKEKQILANQKAPSKPAEEPKTKFKAPRPTNKKPTDNSKKRKATSPHGSTTQTSSNINPLEISDEELLKMFSN